MERAQFAPANNRGFLLTEVVVAAAGRNRLYVFDDRRASESGPGQPCFG